MANTLKDKLRAGQVTYGVWLTMFDSDLVELFGHLGFDYAVFDAEHTALDPSAARDLIRACEVVDMVPIVRVPEINRSQILRYLEIGAVGIYVPHLKTADQARELVDAVKYAPLGHRGAGRMRAIEFGLADSLPDRYRQANDDTMTFALVEDLEGIENLDDIIAVDTLDGFSVGRGDLSHQMGHPGEKAHPEVEALAVEAEARLTAAGKVIEATVADAAEALDYINRGCLMISMTLQPIVIAGARKFLSDVGAR